MRFGIKSPQRSVFRRPSRKFASHIESLEDRCLLSVFAVTNTNDAGAGSLRQAIMDANALPGADSIHFTIPGSPGTVHEIQSLTQLPIVSDEVNIDGYTQPGASRNTQLLGNNAKLRIVLDGALQSGPYSGLRISAGNSSVHGLVISNYSTGIALSGNGNNAVSGNFIGTTGGVAAGNLVGLAIDGSNNNLIGGPARGDRNMISGNTHYGLAISNSANSNRVMNNYVGSDVTGGGAIPNGLAGILMNSSASDNIIGTDGDGFDDASEKNVIAGNTGPGILLSSSIGNVIAGNFIGTNALGTSPLGNTQGISIGAFASDNLIGTNGDNKSDVFERNVISGNSHGGVLISRSGADNNAVAGNFIGPDKTGTAALGNGGVNTAGLTIDLGAGNNLVGAQGTAGDDARRNVISGNYRGIRIIRGSDGNKISGNFIGLNASGSGAMGNQTQGIQVAMNSLNTVIGSDDNAATNSTRNVISGNGGGGIFVQSDTTIVAGNYIGLNSVGTATLGNTGNGIAVSGGGGVTEVRIGTDGDGKDDSFEANLIAGNTENGILIDGRSGTHSNIIIAGNLIGTNSSGAPLGNGASGIGIIRAGNNSIGGSEMANTIAFNGNDGISITGNSAKLNNMNVNSIYGNGDLAIDLNDDGISPNDFRDDDDGPNDLLNFPVITSINTNANRVSGFYQGIPNQQVSLDFYLTPSGAQVPEAKDYLKTLTVFTDPAGFVIFTTPLATVNEQTVTALARVGSSTSELSPHGPIARAGTAYEVAAGFDVPLDASSTDDLNQDPETLTYEWDLDGDGIFGETGTKAVRGDELGIHPAFSSAGMDHNDTFIVKLRVTDSTGSSSEAIARIEAVAIDVIGGVLRVGGSLQNDNIEIIDIPSVDVTLVKFDGTVIGAGREANRIEVRGQSGDDNISVDGSITSLLDGGSGNDTLVGGNEPDTMIGGEGDDSFAGNQGFDFATGGNGNDFADNTVETFNGGAGQDGVIFHGTDGPDTIRVWWTPGEAWADINGEITSQAYKEGEVIIVHSGAGNDRVKMEESAGFHWIAEFHGGPGRDKLFGGVNDDRLFGGPGKDRLVGNGGNDALVGGRGRDVLLGGTGRDLLIGGRGRDIMGGGSGQDLLISGHTEYDNHTDAIDAIMAEWSSGRALKRRVNRLTSGILTSDFEVIRLNSSLVNGRVANGSTSRAVSQSKRLRQDTIRQNLWSTF